MQRKQLSPWHHFLTGTGDRGPLTHWTVSPDTPPDPEGTQVGANWYYVVVLEQSERLEGADWKWSYLSVAHEAKVRRCHPQPYTDTGQLQHFTGQSRGGRGSRCWRGWLNGFAVRLVHLGSWKKKRENVWWEATQHLTTWMACKYCELGTKFLGWPSSVLLLASGRGHVCWLCLFSGTVNLEHLLEHHSSLLQHTKYTHHTTSRCVYVR